MKKILVLGGSDIQIPLIKKIKELGFYSITCDYLPNNPGHKYSDEYHNLSVLDEEGLFNLCSNLKIDAIIPYTSESAVITASKVCHKLNLPSNTVESCEIMTKKNLFRDFLKNNGFNYPNYISTSSFYEFEKFVKNIGKSVVIKPIDACGSKGVFKVNPNDNLKDIFDKTISFSREGKIVVEEFISKKGYQIGGDGFVQDGKLKFHTFGDIHFSKTNPLLPCSVSLPSSHTKEVLDKVHETIQSLLTKVGLKMGGLNFDIIVDESDNVYLIEIAARNGGNMIPELTQYCTGIDMKEFVIYSSLGLNYEIPKIYEEKKFFSHIVVHSQKSGKVKNIKLSEEIKKCILESHINFDIGDFIPKYENSTNRLGLLLMNYENEKQMLEIIYNFDKHFEIELYE